MVLRFAQKKHIKLQLRGLCLHFDEMIQALGCGEHIEFRGFGTLHCQKL